MTKKTTSSPEESPPASTMGLFSWKYLIPLSLSVVIGILIGVTLFHHLPWISLNQNDGIVDDLKSKTDSLDQRMNQLDTTLKDLPTKVTAQESDSPYIKDLEERIGLLSQRIETIQSQPTVDKQHQQSESFQELTKEIHYLRETQKLTRAFMLFVRLKAKVLSAKPYRTELDDFKASATEFPELPTLEKYADQALSPNSPSKDNGQAVSAPDEPSNSWWNRLKALSKTFIKIEKADSSLPSIHPSTLLHQPVDEALNSIENNLIAQLKTISFSPSPQPGDSL